MAERDIDSQEPWIAFRMITGLAIASANGVRRP
jgi:hypothetical protein